MTEPDSDAEWADDLRAFIEDAGFERPPQFVLEGLKRLLPRGRRRAVLLSDSSRGWWGVMTDRKLTPAMEWVRRKCSTVQNGGYVDWNNGIPHPEQIVDIIAAAVLEARLYELSRAANAATIYRYNGKTGKYDIPACNCTEEIRALDAKLRATNGR